VAVVLLMLATVYASAVQTAKLNVTLGHDTRISSYRLIVELNRDNSSWLYAIPPLSLMVPAYNDLQRYMIPHGVGLAWYEHERFWDFEMASWSAFEGARNKGVIPSDGVTARVSTGVYGYYLTDLTLIDILGLTDRYVAHQPVTRPNSERVMAHDRLGELAYLDKRGFNLLFDPVKPTRDQAFDMQNFVLQLRDDAWAPLAVRKHEWFEHSQWGLPVWELVASQEIGCFGAETAPGWNLEGDAFRLERMPWAPVNPWPRRCDMTFGLSSKDGKDGVHRRGTARSPAFTARAGTRLEVRLCGKGPRAGVRVIDENGLELARVVPSDADWLLRDSVDLSRFAGRTVRVEAFDEDDTSWLSCAGVVVLEARRWGGR